MVDDREEVVHILVHTVDQEVVQGVYKITVLEEEADHHLVDHAHQLAIIEWRRCHQTTNTSAVKEL